MCCWRLAGNTGHKNDAKNRHLRPSHNIVGLYLRNWGTYWQSEKNLLSRNIFPTCPYNMVNFGPLPAEIVSLVWGTSTNFNGFCVLAALLHSQTAALNRGRHLYSTGRPSRWALAHMSSFSYCAILYKSSISENYLILRMHLPKNRKSWVKV